MATASLAPRASGRRIERKACEKCGVVFEFTWYGRPRRFCRSCHTPSRDVIPARECGHCGQLFVSKDKSQKYCGQSCWKAHEKGRSRATDPHTGKFIAGARETRECVRCGAEFVVDKKDRRYCSRSCAFNDPMWRKRDAPCGVCGKIVNGVPLSMVSDGAVWCSRLCMLQHPAYRKRIADGWAKAKAQGTWKPAHGNCAKCGLEIPRRRRYCDGCRDAAITERLGKKANPKVARVCDHCGKGFWSGVKRQRFCCVPCSRAASKHARRVRLRGGAIEAVASWQVYVRDKWKCHICGRPTPVSLMGTLAPNAPSIDHIETVVDGGAHTMANLRCACRQCNSEKSGRSMGQPFLF